LTLTLFFYAKLLAMKKLPIDVTSFEQIRDKSQDYLYIISICFSSETKNISEFAWEVI